MSQRAEHADSSARAAILAVPVDEEVRGRIRKAIKTAAEQA